MVVNTDANGSVNPSQRMASVHSAMETRINGLYLRRGCLASVKTSWMVVRETKLPRVVQRDQTGPARKMMAMIFEGRARANYSEAG